MLEKYPGSAGTWLPLADLEEELFPQFKLDWGCPNLRLGTLLRGLGKETQKREESYIDETGRRRSVMSYLVPEAAVVELAHAKRKRA